jgi:hypothetical protein
LVGHQKFPESIIFKNKKNWGRQIFEGQAGDDNLSI